MGKVIVLIIFTGLGAWVLKSTGLFDGMTSSNLDERKEFWLEQFSHNVPMGSSKQTVDEFMAKYGLQLHCSQKSMNTVLTDCYVDDPMSHGGMGKHKLVLTLDFTFEDDVLKHYEALPSQPFPAG